MSYVRELLWVEILIYQLVSGMVVYIALNILTILSIEYTVDKIFEDQPVLALWSNDQLKLNPEQKKSLCNAIKNKFQLIQGPPGNKLYSIYIWHSVCTHLCTHLCMCNSVCIYNYRYWKVSNWSSSCLCLHCCQ